MADEAKEPVYVNQEGGEYHSLVRFIANDLIETVRKYQVDDPLTDDGRQATWMEISEGILAEGGERFVNNVLEQVNLTLFTYGK